MLGQPGRAEEHHRVPNLLPPEMRERLEILRQNAQCPRIRADQEFFIQVRDRIPVGMGSHFVLHFSPILLLFFLNRAPFRAARAVWERLLRPAAKHQPQTPASRQSAPPPPRRRQYRSGRKRSRPHVPSNVPRNPPARPAAHSAPAPSSPPGPSARK